jgi:hypothetical protein
VTHCTDAASRGSLVLKCVTGRQSASRDALANSLINAPRRAARPPGKARNRHCDREMTHLGGSCPSSRPARTRTSRARRSFGLKKARCSCSSVALRNAAHGEGRAVLRAILAVSLSPRPAEVRLRAVNAHVECRAPYGDCRSLASTYPAIGTARRLPPSNRPAYRDVVVSSGSLILHCDGTLAGCSEDDEPQGCQDATSVTKATRGDASSGGRGTTDAGYTSERERPRQWRTRPSQSVLRFASPEAARTARHVAQPRGEPSQLRDARCRRQTRLAPSARVWSASASTVCAASLLVCKTAGQTVYAAQSGRLGHSIGARRTPPTAWRRIAIELRRRRTCAAASEAPRRR